LDQIIVYILPFFLILMGVEFGYGWVKRRNNYHLADALSSLSQGLISQLLALVTQLFQIGLYALVFHALAISPHIKFWGTWAGWIAAIVLFDFFDYWLHRAGHECAVMWAAHVVHHQSQHFNFTTALRQESAVAFIGWMFYLPMALLGVPPEQFAIAGLVVLVYQFWIHTEHIGKLGWFDRVFSSPSNHRVHHAVNDQYIDKNYGGMLVIWDRMFGTFAEEKEACVYGTRTPLASWDPAWAITAEYWSLVQASRRAATWPDKVRIWFKHPGWRPEGYYAKAGITAPPAVFDLEAARQHYEAPGAAPVPLFAAAHFTLMMFATAGYLWAADELSYPQSLGLTAIAVAGLWGLGAHLQGRMRVLPVVLIDLAGAAAAWLILAR
jgi:sterol desaturase/sphingolipid hydroxylase (fatty acid hydroxylase superfamily)